MADYLLGCFGKLPIDPEFIRYNSAGIDVQELERWFQEGIHFSRAKLLADWEGAFADSTPWNFVFHSGSSDAFLVGVLVRSRDEEGRLYPFAIFLRVNRASFGAPAWFAPRVFGRFLEDVERLALSGWEGLDRDAFLAVLANLEVSAELDGRKSMAAFQQEIASQPSRSFWTDVFGAFEDERKHHVPNGLASFMRPLRHTPLDRFSLGLKFPLAARGKKAAQLDIPFWMTLSSRMAGQEKARPILFWTRERQPSLMAFFRRPSPKTFLFLVAPDRDEETWYDLTQTSGQNEELSLEQQHSLEDGTQSMATLLDSLSRAPDRGDTDLEPGRGKVGAADMARPAGVAGLLRRIGDLFRDLLDALRGR